MKAYLAAPFRRYTNDMTGRAYGELWKSDYIQFLERIEVLLGRFGIETCLPHRDAGKWGKIYIDPQYVAEMCFRIIDDCDLFIAIPESSRGVHIELGYAIKAGKKIAIFIHKNAVESGFYAGLHKVVDCVVIKYESEDDLLENIEKLANIVTHQKLSPINNIEKRYALLDVGSFTTKLTVAELKDAIVSVILKTENSTALAEGLAVGDAIKKESLDKTIQTVREWQNLLRANRVSSVKAIATGAARDAANSSTLVKEFSKVTGCELEIISEDDEARALYSGVVIDFPDNLAFAVLNVGGQNTRLIIGSKHQISKIYQLPLGTVRLGKMFIANYPPSDEGYHSMLDYIQQVLAEHNVPKLSEQNIFVHTGGELDYLISCDCSLGDSHLSPSHLKVATVADFETFSERIRKLNLDQLHALKPSNPKWMEGAIASNAIALVLAKQLGVQQIIPSNKNVTDGFLLELDRKVRLYHGR